MRYCVYCGEKFNTIRQLFPSSEFCSKTCRVSLFQDQTKWKHLGSDDNLSTDVADPTTGVAIGESYSTERIDAVDAHQFVWKNIIHTAKHLGEEPPIVGRRTCSVVQFKSGSAKTPLFFIGAGLSEFRLSQLIRTKCAVFAIEAPWPTKWRVAAEKNKRSDLPSLEQIAARHVAAVMPHLGLGRCALAGISFNGLIAFEMAHQLNRRGGNVEMVMLLDSQAKQWTPYQVARQTIQKDLEGFRRRSSINRKTSALPYLRKSCLTICWAIVEVTKRVLHRLLDPVLGDHITIKVDDVGVPLCSSSMLRVYANALSTYRFYRLDSRGVLFRADVQHERPARALDGSLGWGNQFGRGLEVIQMGGDHGTMVQKKPHILALALQMSRLLDQWAAAGRTVTTSRAHAK